MHRRLLHGFLALKFPRFLKELWTALILLKMAAPTTTSSVPHAGTYPAGYLTTAFKPTDSYCSSGFYRYETNICLPTRWNVYYSAASSYSPAICPYAWKSAAVPPYGFGPPQEQTGTGIVCCPTYAMHLFSSIQLCVLTREQGVCAYFISLFILYMRLTNYLYYNRLFPDMDFLA